MEKTKDQLLLMKLHKVGRKARMSLFLGQRPPMGHHPFGPGMCPSFGSGMRPPMGPHGGPAVPPARARERILLIVLEADESGIRQKDIAEAIGINPSSLSEQIDRLESDGYLDRKVNPEDRRSTLITLTEKGRARAYELLDDRRKGAAAFCSKLTEDEKDTLIALLDKLLSE